MPNSNQVAVFAPMSPGLVSELQLEPSLKVSQAASVAEVLERREAERPGVLVFDVAALGPEDARDLVRLREAGGVLLGIDPASTSSAQNSALRALCSDFLTASELADGLLLRSVLRASERRTFSAPLRLDELRALLGACREGLLLLDRDQRIILANDSAGRLLRAAPATLEGQPFPLTLDHGGSSDLGNHGNPALSFKAHELTWDRRTASLVVVEDASAARERRDYRSQLLHADRLAAMGQLAAGVAHEVNNPAAYVTANLSILGEHLQKFMQSLQAMRDLVRDDPARTLALESLLGHGEVDRLMTDAREIIAENLEGMSRISTIVRDLKNFSRIEREQVEMVHLNQLVNAACNLVHNQLRHRALLVKDLGEVPLIAADRGKLTQVLMNLLINAAQAIPESSSAQHYIRLRTRAESDRVIISVSDTGAGIPEELQARIFEPFFTTKPRERGTGLGLSICADIIRQHGGDIRVASVVGQGSQFEVVLPRQTGLIPGKRPQAERSAELPVRGARILLIDDEPMLLKAYRRLLCPPHEVVTAAGGPDALAVLERDRDFDVVICDLMMPQIDGPMLFEMLERLAPELKPRFIFVSGGAFSARAKEFLDTVENVCLEKPVAVHELNHAIAEALRGSLERRVANASLRGR